MTSLITSLGWVPRGHAAAYPTKYALDEDEYTRIAKSLKLSLDDAKQDLEHEQARQNGHDMDEAQGSVDMKEDDDENYSDSDDDDDDDDDDIEVNELSARPQPEPRRPGETEEEAVNRIYGLDEYDGSDGDSANEADQSVFGTIKSLAYHANGEEDPYLTLPENEASDDEDREELQILPTDNLILAARVEDEVAHLECYVYDDQSENLYVHHDVMLPAIPLAVEWIGRTKVSRNDEGNFCAVATMDPDIEIWNLDIVDSMYPSAILGAATIGDATFEKKKKSKKSKKSNDSYHVDSVLALASNPNHRNLLASSSADKTVKLWDLSTCTAASSYSQHTDKVCALAWHPSQSSVFLSGSYDRTVIASDARAPTAKGPTWGVESDVETINCDPHNENIFYASTENGVLHCFDARTLPSSPETSKALWRLQAHDKALSTFSVNPVIPGFVATGSQDRTTKLWDTQASTGPSLVTSRDLGVGKVFALDFAPDAEVGFRLAAAGSKGAVQIWDTSLNKAVRAAFAGRVGHAKFSENKEDKLVGVQDDVDDEEDDEPEGQHQSGGASGIGWESMDED
ncbi:WD40 repeat-like protein [Polychaeton citri CBS 116435]|uniref:WD40 repeat-like protein n=1 Tax=Polychaeton citri CBS 116435 TaxID=1314669 RepID=A0A9P4QCC7_9PEZI|nr:WD40 repeat-like protein [Polychaeton citri CBS 116435]